MASAFGAVMMMKRLQYLVGPTGRKEGRIHEHDSTAIAPDADADGLRVAKTGILLGESFNLSGGANSK